MIKGTLNPSPLMLTKPSHKKTLQILVPLLSVWVCVEHAASKFAASIETQHSVNIQDKMIQVCAGSFGIKINHHGPPPEEIACKLSYKSNLD